MRNFAAQLSSARSENCVPCFVVEGWDVREFDLMIERRWVTLFGNIKEHVPKGILSSTHTQVSNLTHDGKCDAASSLLMALNESMTVASGTTHSE